MKSIMVTTQHRGVFFGYIEDGELPKTLPGHVSLSNARNCVHWSRDCKGFLGLATTGPTGSCRIGPRVESITLYDVTSVVCVSKDASEKWESAPWS